MTRESLGRMVRQVWVAWALEQPSPKPSWLLPWEALDEGQREVDMRIGETLHEAGRQTQDKQSTQLEQISPADQMEDAHQRRDFFGVIEAGNAGYRALKSAPWYPAQTGDILHIHFEATANVAESGETYLVEHSDDEGGLVLRLLCASANDDGTSGAYAPGIVDDPFMDPWMEAGQHRLTIVRNGRVAHGGVR